MTLSGSYSPTRKWRKGQLLLHDLTTRQRQAEEKKERTERGKHKINSKGDTGSETKPNICSTLIYTYIHKCTLFFHGGSQRNYGTLATCCDHNIPLLLCPHTRPPSLLTCTKRKAFGVSNAKDIEEVTVPWLNFLNKLLYITIKLLEIRHGRHARQSRYFDVINTSSECFRNTIRSVTDTR